MKVLNYHSQINISSIRCFCMSVFTFNRIYHERGSVDRGNYIDQSIYGQTQIIDVVLHFIISVQSNAFFLLLSFVQCIWCVSSARTKYKHVLKERSFFLKLYEIINYVIKLCNNKIIFKEDSFNLSTIFIGCYTLRLNSNFIPFKMWIVFYRKHMRSIQMNKATPFRDIGNRLNPKMNPSCFYKL